MPRRDAHDLIVSQCMYFHWYHYINQTIRLYSYSAGEAGAAKTQLCLQLLLAAQLPLSIGGLNGSAVYIFTEGKPPIDRLKELSTILPYRWVRMVI